MYEVLSVGSVPYGSMSPLDVVDFIEAGKRLEQPILCPLDLYVLTSLLQAIGQRFRFSMMKLCWSVEPTDRPTFKDVRKFLAARLEYAAAGYGYVDATEAALA